MKIFRITSEKYRNRRRRFGLRITLISSICNKLLGFRGYERGLVLQGEKKQIARK